MQSLYQSIKSAKKKSISILIDPDKQDKTSLKKICLALNQSQVDYVMVGGSLLTKNNFETTIQFIKNETSIPVIIFPGNVLQISDKADAILFLSLISGRNSEMLIGRHVISAPLIKESKLTCIPTGYMLVDGGTHTAVQYMSNTMPIPADKLEIAVSTALAGQLLGMQLIYMDAGSGAKQRISDEMIKAVKKNIDIPLIIGGGIRDIKSAVAACKAGADMIVVGNAIESSPALIAKISDAIKSI